MNTATVQTAGARHAPTSRKLAPDLARGAMLLLIAVSYATYHAITGEVSFGADYSTLDRVTDVITTLLLNSRALPMFAVLFGYGMAWMVARRVNRGYMPKQVRRNIRRRAYALLAFGAVHAFLYPLEILMPYGLALLISSWLLFRSNRAQLLAAGISAGICSLLIFATRIGEQLESAGAAGEVGDLAIDYTSAGALIERAMGVPIMPFLVVATSMALPMMVLGYFAGRIGLLDEPQKHRQALRRIATIGFLVSIGGAVPLALTSMEVVVPGDVAHGAFFAIHVITGAFGGAAYAAMFALLSIRLAPGRGWLTRAVSAVGQRSLTFYLTNSVILALVLNPNLIGISSGPFGALITAVLVWSGGLVVANALDRAERPGPLEHLMRSFVNR